MVETDHFGMGFSEYKYGDLHTHTSYSKGDVFHDGNLSPQQIVDIAEERELSFLAITDHDNVAPSFIGKEHQIKQGYKVDVLTGVEVSSSDGHILALGVESNLPFWMSAKETVRAIHEQGGLAIAAHPFFRLTDSVGEKILREVAEDEDPQISWDGIEVFNAGVNDWRFIERVAYRLLPDGNRKARSFYQREEKSGIYGAAVAGSDTHSSGVGRAVTIIPSELDIYTAIKDNKTAVIMTDEKEGYSLKSMVNTRRKSNLLENLRRTLPREMRIFPSLEDSR